MLNNRIEIPILGIGTYTLSSQQMENSVYWALRDGYRLINTARIYGNEDGVGRGIQRAISEGIVTRKEIFVTTKMWTSDYGNGAAAIDASLRRLGLDYIDLMILHHSQPSNDVAAYQAMEQAVSEGKLRSIGLSNYYTAEDFDRLVNATTITPALLQNKTHLHYQSTAMKEPSKAVWDGSGIQVPSGRAGLHAGTVQRPYDFLHRSGSRQDLRADPPALASPGGQYPFPVPATKPISRRTLRFLTLN